MQILQAKLDSTGKSQVTDTQADLRVKAHLKSSYEGLLLLELLHAGQSYVS